MQGIQLDPVNALLALVALLIFFSVARCAKDFLLFTLRVFAALAFGGVLILTAWTLSTQPQVRTQTLAALNNFVQLTRNLLALAVPVEPVPTPTPTPAPAPDPQAVFTLAGAVGRLWPW